MQCIQFAAVTANIALDVIGIYFVEVFNPNCSWLCLPCLRQTFTIKHMQLQLPYLVTFPCKYVSNKID